MDLYRRSTEAMDNYSLTIDKEDKGKKPRHLQFLVVEHGVVGAMHVGIGCLCLQWLLLVSRPPASCIRLPVRNPGKITWFCILILVHCANTVRPKNWSNCTILTATKCLHQVWWYFRHSIVCLEYLGENMKSIQECIRVKRCHRCWECFDQQLPKSSFTCWRKSSSLHNENTLIHHQPVSIKTWCGLRKKNGNERWSLHTQPKLRERSFPVPRGMMPTGGTLPLGDDICSSLRHESTHPTVPSPPATCTLHELRNQTFNNSPLQGDLYTLFTTYETFLLLPKWQCQRQTKWWKLRLQKRSRMKKWHTMIRRLLRINRAHSSPEVANLSRHPIP